MKANPLAPLLIACFLCCTSCFTTDRSLGTDFLPADGDEYMNRLTLPAPMYTCTPDSMMMSNSRYMLFGSIATPEFGRTDCGTALQLLPNKMPLQYGPDPVLTSCRLEIPIESRTCFDESQARIPQRIYVYRITKDLGPQNMYSNSIGPGDYDPVPINVPGNLYFGTDTLKIRLTDAFATLLLNASQAERDSIARFVKQFKGLYVTTAPQAGEGGRLNKASLNAAVLYLNYRSAGGDSVRLFYPNTAAFNLITAAHKSGALESANPTETLYLEGLAGVKPYLDMKETLAAIRQQCAQQGIDPAKMLISRARLVLKTRHRTDDNYANLNHYPDSIYTCITSGTDSTRYFQITRDIYNDTGAGALNRSKFQYEFNISASLQEALTKDNPADRLYLLPYSVYKTPSRNIFGFYQNSSGNTSYAINNYDYRQARFYGNKAAEGPLLEITYMVLK